MPERNPIDFGDLRRLTPLDPDWGLGRGTPIDRYYIERFLGAHAADIHGPVLEVAGDDYTRRVGADRVSRSSILHRDASNPRASIGADLSDAPQLADAQFDCFICTQTLTCIYALERTIRTIHRILKPGGAVLVSVPGISQISPLDKAAYGEYWRFTEQSLGRLLGEVCGAEQVVATAHGNVLASIGFLHGVAVEDLRGDELDANDPAYPLLITGRAVKAG